MARFTSYFEKTDEGKYIAYCVEIPGTNTQGDTLDEARENLKRAIPLQIEALREVAQRYASPNAIKEEIQLDEVLS